MAKRNIAGIPFETMEGPQTENYEHGWESPPGVSPQYRARLGHGEPNKKNPLKRKADGSGPWFFQAQIHDGKRYVTCAIGKFGDVAKEIAKVVKGSLVIPEAAPVAAQVQSTRKRAKRSKKNGHTRSRKASSAEMAAGEQTPDELRAHAEQEAVNPS